MPFFAILGCDGSGKSTVLDAVEAHWHDRSLPVRRGHWRPAPLDAKRSSSDHAADPHARPPRGTLASLAKLLWLWSSWWLGWFKELRTYSHHGIVLFDRYHADLLVDPLRYRYGAPLALARLISSWMPQPDAVIYLDAPAEVLWQRKQELPPEQLAQSRQAYLTLARNHQRIHVIDASQAIETVVAETIARLEAFLPTSK